jgi:hypothetical protein
LTSMKRFWANNFGISSTLWILQTGMNGPRLLRGLLLKEIRSNPSEIPRSVKPNLTIRLNGRWFIRPFWNQAERTSVSDLTALERDIIFDCKLSSFWWYNQTWMRRRDRVIVKILTGFSSHSGL